MKIKTNVFLILGTAFLLLTWLFTGVFRDDEFYDPDLFTKYRATFKVYFSSPIGMQDMKIEDLSPNGQLEEIAFQEFVIKQEIQNNGNGHLWFMPYVLIQLTLTF